MCNNDKAGSKKIKVFSDFKSIICHGPAIKQSDLCLVEQYIKDNHLSYVLAVRDNVQAPGLMTYEYDLDNVGGLHYMCLKMLCQECAERRQQAFAQTQNNKKR